MKVPCPTAMHHKNTGWNGMTKRSRSRNFTRWKVYRLYQNQNVYVKELATGKEKQLSLDGTLSNYYSVYIRWSPDSKKWHPAKSAQ